MLPEVIRRTRTRGFSLVEMALVSMIAALLLWLVVVTLIRGSNVVTESLATSWYTDNLAAASQQIRSDLISTRRSWISAGTFTDAGFDGEQTAVVIQTARNDDQQFEFLANEDPVTAFTPDWQGVIVYCPYKTSGGVTELRRYACFPGSSHTWPFSLHSQSADPAVKADTIRLRDDGSKKYLIDRHLGNLGANQPYRVVGTDVFVSDFIDEILDDPVTVELTAVVDAAVYPWMNLVRTFSVYPRN